MTALAVPSTPIIRNQIRPFVVAARPTVRNLRPAAVHLAAATPNLGTTFKIFNHFLNMLGYSPAAPQHGYLWWLAWLDHNARSVFSNQDANGDYRNLFVQLSCDSMVQTVNASPLSEVVLNLTPILTNAKLCPASALQSARDYQLYREGKLSRRAATADAGGLNVPFLPKLSAH
jgi:phospholipid/cholesterol/gamma-HCH transport system substrate-binding protein